MRTRRPLQTARSTQRPTPTCRFSLVLRVLLIALIPGLKDMDQNSILGLSTLGWLTFVFLWIVQVIIVRYGMDMIRKYEAYAGPIILVTLVILAVWMFTKVDGAISWSPPHSLTGGAMWREIFAAGALWVSIWFFGAGIAALCYYFLADRHGEYHDVSGEPIADP